MAFVSSNERQQNLQPMRKPLREAVHEMAQAFALTTQSYGQEPTRYIRLIKVPCCSSHQMLDSCLMFHARINKTFKPIIA